MTPQPGPDRFAGPLSRRAEAFAAPASPEGKAYARAAYGKGWFLYHESRNGRGGAAAIEAAYSLAREACELFSRLRDGFALAKALELFALLSGILGRRSQSNDSSRRALELLESLDPPGADDKDKRLLIIMKSLRALAENSAVAEECVRYARRGMEALDKLGWERTRPDEHHRYLGLLHRGLGAALGRVRPRTPLTLGDSEQALDAAIASFERVRASPDPVSLTKSRGKAYRELARTRRALAALLGDADPAAAARAREGALQAAGRALELFAAVGGGSHWNHYQRAKALRDVGRLEEALEEALKGVALVESGRADYSEEEHRIEWMAEKLAVYDHAIYLAMRLDKKELAFDLAQGCKARAFLESLGGPAAAGPSAPPVVRKSTAELQGMLEEGEALVEYHLGRHALSIFVLTKAGLAAARVSRDGDRVDGAVRNFMALLRQPRSDINAFYIEEVLRELAELLLAPVMDSLSRACRLFVVPSRGIALLPFSALPVGGGPALNRWEIVELPSSALLRRATAPPPPARLLVLGDPWRDLPYAADESREISLAFPDAQVFVGEQATKEALAGLERATHLHIACHGYYHDGDARGSLLHLAAYAHDDGVLKVPEIRALPLGRLELAFLSCCRSAHGRQRAGDEFEGVHRAFLSAGARTVVATLWDIEDGVSRHLVAAFYRHLKDGKSKAAALRLAKLDVKAGHPHPYFWAGFKLIGAP